MPNEPLEIHIQNNSKQTHSEEQPPRPPQLEVKIPGIWERFRGRQVLQFRHQQRVVARLGGTSTGPRWWLAFAHLKLQTAHASWWQVLWFRYQQVHVSLQLDFQWAL